MSGLESGTKHPWIRLSCYCLPARWRVINKGSKGPDLVNIWKVPKSTKKLLQCPQALLSFFKPIINNENPKNARRKNYQILNIAYFLSVLPCAPHSHRAFFGNQQGRDLFDSTVALLSASLSGGPCLPKNGPHRAQNRKEHGLQSGSNRAEQVMSFFCFLCFLI